MAEGASLLRTYRGNPIASSNLALPALKGLRFAEAFELLKGSFFKIWRDFGHDLLDGDHFSFLPSLKALPTISPRTR